ncbi:MAG: GntR family transcriptional regulator [Pseudomonadota bacterium]
MRTNTQRVSKVDYVYERLRASIINGERPPGAVLDKAELAHEFGASRQPIASALDRLESYGLVRIVPQHGSFVSKLDKKQIAGRFFVRRAIEVELMLAMDGRVTPDLIEQLDFNLRYQRVALDARDYDSLYDWDQKFHDLIHARVPIDEAARVLDRAEAFLSRCRRLMMPEPTRAGKTVSEHEAIRDALAAHDAQGAAAAMRAHMNAVQQHFDQFVIEQPELFETDNSAPKLGRK